MAAIQKLSAALLAGSQESTLALAALNFDFSLWKVEAPKEFQALGSVLSEDRRNIAENGNHHLTARRLGALFRGKLPAAPRIRNLHHAYGARVSEIAKEAASTTRETPRQLGLFAKQLGVDGTAIWAAATSGYEALCVQLLACIIARVWPAPEATAIWAEIVEARKQELMTGDESGFDFHELVARQASITREQLAEWDSSARAWVRTADGVKKKQQVQLRLIVNNLDALVNHESATYESVMSAWLTSMEVVESLVSGKPQSVYDGAVLVALTAWHIYPDMVVFQDGFRNIEQNDPLVAESGILTVGLQASPDQVKGVSWSLPLSRLRYYGPPVTTTQAVGPRNSRITMKELVYIALGCLSQAWSEGESGSWIVEQENTTPNAGLQQMCEYYIWMWDWLERTHDLKPTDTWLHYIVEAAKTVIANNIDNKQKSIGRLIGFGQRHCDKFLGLRLDVERQMWSRRINGFLNVLYPEKRIYYLRSIAETISRLSRQKELAMSDRKEHEDWIIAYRIKSAIVLASVFPDSHPDEDRDEFFHYRYKVEGAQGISNIAVNVDTATVIEDMTRYCDASIRNTVDKCLVLKFFRRSSKARDNDNLLRRWVFPRSSRDGHDKKMREMYHPRLQFESQLSRARADPLAEAELVFEFVTGSMEHGGALYRKRESTSPFLKSDDKLLEASVSFQQIQKAFEDCWVDPEAFAKIARGPTPLRVLGTAVQLYADFPESTISMDVTSTPLATAKWALSASEPTHWYQTLETDRTTILSCIAFFETGQLQLEPKELEPVMAMSIEDSLYVSGSVVDDPGSHQPNRRVYRALGNIGKPGVSLLISPADPWVRERQNDDWDLINHDLYDGKYEDSFRETSLHLSLTDYRVPYVRAHLGKREWQAYFQEAVVSIYDGGVWVGDIDILKGLSMAQIARGCKHIASSSGGVSSWFSKGPKITTVDSWHELLDQPKNAAVVRAHKNCFGRLATAILSAQLGMRTVVLPEEPCRKCHGDYSSFQAWLKQNPKLFKDPNTGEGTMIIC